MLAVLTSASLVAAVMAQRPQTTNTEWRYYGGDPASTRSSPLDLSFGTNGKVDAIAELPYAVRQRNYGITSTPVIVKNVIISGASIHDGAANKEAPRGDISGYDVRTGKRLWTFHSVPQPGEFGHDTWEDGSAAYTGNTNVWPMLTMDEALGYVYLPFGTPTNDYYGGHRVGHNLFAESLVCLDATTGKRVWHFQAVHNGLWDYDFGSVPALGDIAVDANASASWRRSASRDSSTSSPSSSSQQLEVGDALPSYIARHARRARCRCMRGGFLDPARGGRGDQP